MSKFLKSLIILLLLLHCIDDVMAQRVRDVLDPNSLNLSLFNMDKYNEIAGSPYIDEDFVIGELTVKGGKSFEEIQMKYNAYEDALLVGLQTDVYALLDASQLEGFQYMRNDELMKFKVLKLDNTRHFYQVIFDDNVQYLRKYVAILGQSKNNAGSYGDEGMQGQSFKHLTSQFLVLPDGSVKEIKTSKKSILEALGTHSDQLEAYIKKQKLKFKNDGDMIAILQYYNGLETNN